MENASKALLMAASVLIGVLLITLLVYVFYFGSEYSSKIKDNIASREAYETNIKFEVYDGRKDLTIHDVQTILNLVKDYNEEADASNKITPIGVTSISLENELGKDAKEYQKTTYSCVISHNDEKITQIKITKNP